MKSRGFTLIELLVTLAILSVLATLAFPAAVIVERRHKEQELRLALKQIRQALDAYKQAVDDGRIPRKTESGYPPGLLELVTGVQDSSGNKAYFLRRLPVDPFAEKDRPAEQSWGLRSYASPPDQPAPGQDVFDVYSRSEAKGLDGSIYRSW